MLPMPKLLTMLIVVSPPRLKLDSGDRLKEYFTPFTRLVRRAGEGGVPGGKAVPSAAGGGALMPCSILQICKFIRQQLRQTVYVLGGYWYRPSLAFNDQLSLSV